MHTRPTTLRHPVLAGTLGLSVVLLTGGCSSTPGSSDAPTRNVSPAEFQGPPVSVVSKTASTKPAPAGVASQPVPGATPPATTSLERLNEGVSDVAVIAGEPQGVVSPSAQPAGGGVVVDTLVGQINGKPVFANTFFEKNKLDGQLNANLYTAKNAAAWTQSARELIAQKLYDAIRDELLLSEARANLSPEERKGLINFLTRLRENIASINQGSSIAADESLRTDGNETLESKAQNERDKALLRSLYARQIEPRTGVTWRDVRKEYERNERQYNPAPEAMLRMIWVKKDKPADIESLKQRLAAGEDFTLLAQSELNAFSRREGGTIPPRKIETSYAQTKFVEDPALNTLIQGLSPGQVGGPTEFSGHLVWVRLDRIEQAPGVSLEQAQLEINAKVRDRKFKAEFERYFSKLLQSGSSTNETQMLDRLVSLASDRYLDKGEIPAEILKRRAAPPAGKPAAPTGGTKP